MSRTEIYVRLKSKNCWEYVGGASNAWNGSMLIWKKLEEKYLPNYKDIAPEGYKSFIRGMCSRDENIYVHRIDCAMIAEMVGGEHPAMELWNLDRNPDVDISYEDAIVLRGTLDYAIVLGEDALLYAECLETVHKDIGGNLDMQAKIIRDAVAEHGDDIEAFWTNATSVNCASDWLGENDDEQIDNGKFWDIMQTRDGYIKWRKELNNIKD